MNESFLRPLFGYCMLDRVCQGSVSFSVMPMFGTQKLKSVGSFGDADGEEDSQT